MKIFRDWIKWFFVSLSVGLLSIATFNFFIDSTGLFGNKSYLSKAAEDLVSGKMVAGLHNFDDRLFQSLIINKSKKKVDIIALGSSRAMMIRKKFIVNNNEIFFNHSVSGASLEDYMAIVDVYLTEKGYVPQEIIIGVDPWIFNKFHGQSRWKILQENYFHLLSKIMKHPMQEKSSLDGNRWRQLINYEYTFSNILFLKKMLNKRPYYITQTVDIEDSVIVLDGSLYYPLSQRNLDAKVVKQLAVKFAKKGEVSFLERFSQLSNVERFEKFIVYLHQKSVKVTFVLLPYNPISYDLLVNDENYAIIKDIEFYLKQFSKDNGIALLGSYNPHKYNFTSQDFTDGMHGVEMVSEMIFKEYKRK